MSETTFASTESLHRTWRQWWKHLPGWLRIGCWALTISIFIQIVVVIAIYIRISFGLVETTEMLQLRRNGNELTFASNLRKEPFQGFNDLVDGWQGRSNGDVVSIVVGERATEDDLKLIAASFPNLITISVETEDPTAAGIEVLSTCASLRHVRLNSLEIDNRAIEPLTKLPHLVSLDLDGTFVDDGVIAILQQMPELTSVSLRYTDVSFDSLEALRASRPKVFVSSHLDSEPGAILLSIRWPDGRRSRRFAGEFTRGHSQEGWTTSRNLSPDTYGLTWTKQSFQRGDGEYVLNLKLGRYAADPVTIQVQDGKPSTQSVEFQMHVTREEAMSGQPTQDEGSME